MNSLNVVAMHCTKYIFWMFSSSLEAIIITTIVSIWALPISGQAGRYNVPLADFVIGYGPFLYIARMLFYPLVFPGENPKCGSK